MATTDSILVVEYDQAIAEALVDILTDEGYAIYHTLVATDTLQVIAHHQPTLILLDCASGTVDCIALVKEVCAAVLPTTTVAVMTTEPGNVALLRLPYVTEYLPKPFDLNDLLACVARYVQPTLEAKLLESLESG